MHKGITIARTLAMFFRQPRAHTYHAVSDEVVERWNNQHDLMILTTAEGKTTCTLDENITCIL